MGQVVCIYPYVPLMSSTDWSPFHILSFGPGHEREIKETITSARTDNHGKLTDRRLGSQNMSEKGNAFIWKNLATWQGLIRQIIPDGLKSEIPSEIPKARDSFEYIDDFTHFKKFYSEFADYSLLEDAFLTAFPLSFRFVRMFHCCRPPNTETYYCEGIRVLNSSEANDKFRKHFLGNPRFPRISGHHIDGAISYMADSSTRHGHVYFGLDDRFLIRDAGHYLIYGSEYIQSLATFIEGEVGYDLKSELKEVGKPTIFQVNMPVGKFEIEEIRKLVQNALPAWAYCIAHGRNEPGEIDFAIVIREGLPSEFIVGHYHPEEIPDPLRGRMIYKYRTGLKGFLRDNG